MRHIVLAWRPANVAICLLQTKLSNEGRNGQPTHFYQTTDI